MKQGKERWAGAVPDYHSLGYSWSYRACRTLKTTRLFSPRWTPQLLSTAIVFESFECNAVILLPPLPVYPSSILNPGPLELYQLIAFGFHNKYVTEHIPCQTGTMFAVLPPPHTGPITISSIRERIVLPQLPWIWVVSWARYDYRIEIPAPTSTCYSTYP